MKQLQFICIMFLLAITAFTCPQNCLECDDDKFSCIICKKGFTLNPQVNECLINGVGYSYQSQQKWGGSCGSGNRQSPIDITIRNSILCPKDKVMVNRINLTSTSINPQGIDLTVAYQGRSTMTFLDSGVVRQFDSAQFHWHSPSEHTINRRSFDLELHIVHTQNGNTGQYSVIGLLFRINDNLRFDIADHIDFAKLANSQHDRQFSFPWNIRNKMFYHYKGSLTTPPCAETVEWFVITEIYEISRKNFEKIKAAINGGKGNSRQVQTLNGRRPMILGRFCSIYRKFN